MSTANGTPPPDQEPIILDVSYEDARFTAYIGISDADIERAAEWVHAEQFEQGDVHVASLDSSAPVSETLADLMFNLNPDDTLVLLCDSVATRDAALSELGYTPDEAA